MSKPAVALTPRPVVCMIDELRRDVAVADDAVAGRFTHNGVTLTLGLPPDWRTGGLAVDDEWRIEWVKANEGLDLAHAFEVTGECHYLATWELLVTSYCEQQTVGAERSEVTARRMQNWLYAWQRFAENGGHVDDGVAELLRDRLAADAEHLAEHLTGERNHRTLELYALLLTHLALGHVERAMDAVALLAANAEQDVLDDGVHRERSTDYHLIVWRSFVGAIANARAAGLDVPPSLLDRAQRAADFALHVQRPNGTTPALSDGDEGDFRILLARAGDVLDRPDLTWAATGGRSGHPPARRALSFPIGGYHVQRSGWGDGDRPYVHERFAVFDCGPLGDGGHGHYDQLSVELWGAGRALVVDPGRYTYATDAAGAWRQYFKGTAAHNTVCVDGLDQTRFRPGKPRPPLSTARLVARSTTDELDVVVGEAMSPRYDAVHTRTLALVGGDHWIVHDRLRARTTHAYEVRWHLVGGSPRAATIERVGEHVVVRDSGVVLAVPASCGTVSIEDGWVSPSYGIKRPAPVVVIGVDGTDVDVVTTIAPGDDAPLVPADWEWQPC